MAMVCQRCLVSYDQRLQCPTCGDRLHYQPARFSRVQPVSPRKRWQETAWGRVCIGLMLAQGLFHGLRQLATGVLLALNTEGGVRQTVTTPAGFIAVQVLEIVAVVAGGLLAGSGQRNGLVLGAVVGVWNGVICACLQFGSPQSMSSAILYGQPIVQLVLGAVGGWLGYAIWQPVQRPLEAIRPRDKGRAAARPGGWFAGRVSWPRVLAGVGATVACSLSANLLRDLILDATTGRLATTEFQDAVITWELKALGVLFGGFLAGTGTRNGLKQGLCVGLASAVVLIAIEARGAGRHSPAALLIVASTLGLGLIGGWFGSQLFPPLARYPKRTTGFGAAATT